jgi:hypothetical protein
VPAGGVPHTQNTRSASPWTFTLGDRADWPPLAASSYYSSTAERLPYKRLIVVRLHAVAPTAARSGMNDDIYTIQLHETLVVNDELHVLRVPGGWIYRIFDTVQNRPAGQPWTESHPSTTCFVPFDEEYKPKRRQPSRTTLR